MLKDHLKAEGRITKADALQIVEIAQTLFRREPNLLQVQDPVTIVGDIHGQYYDFIKLLDLGGNPERTKYVFLGDYVDRGSFSLECVLVLFALKINYPSTFILLRGNHECRQMTSYFSFRKECLSKGDLDLYDRVMDCFDCLPLAALVNGKFLTVHGGIGPELVTLEDINRVQRYSEPPKTGSYCDLLWADPVESQGRDPPFKTNDVRGCSFFYSQEAVLAFLKRNDILSIIRAHEAQLDGFKMYNWNGDEDFPAVITIFSAPNYCDVYNNKGAIIKFENSTLNIQQFNYTQHPYCLPDFMDVFAWSLPFVVERVAEILYHFTKPQEQDSQRDGTEALERMQEGLHKKRQEILRGGVRNAAQLMKKYRAVREESEFLTKMRRSVSADRVPTDLLRQAPAPLDGSKA